MLIRAARLDDLDHLAALALRSKGHWGYDDAFLEACRDELTVRPVDLEDRIVRVAELAGLSVRRRGGGGGTGRDGALSACCPTGALPGG